MELIERELVKISLAFRGLSDEDAEEVEEEEVELSDGDDEEDDDDADDADAAGDDDDDEKDAARTFCTAVRLMNREPCPAGPVTFTRSHQILRSP